MFIAHLPAGYIASTILHRHLGHGRSTAKAFMLAGMLGAIAPDLDMIYFYLVDQRQHNHHTYFTHFPVVWAGMLLVSIAWRRGMPESSVGMLATVFSLNGLIHLCLDTVVGRIWWLAPFNDQAFWLFTVPALYRPWWLNFLLHWSFLFEVTIVCAAALLIRRNGVSSRTAFFDRSSAP